jgi:hypothetical protein
MNTTLSSEAVNSFNYEATTYVALGLFVLSEVMPFIKKTKGAGVIHSIICLLTGSKCVIDKALEVAEAVVEEKQPDNKV